MIDYSFDNCSLLRNTTQNQVNRSTVLGLFTDLMYISFIHSSRKTILQTKFVHPITVFAL